MPIYTFTCECGFVVEALRGRDVSSHPCPQCDGTAIKDSVYRIGFTGFTRTPIAEREIDARPFMEASAELDYKHQRREDSAQRTIATPGLWTAAKAKATRLMKQGARDSADL